MATKPKTRARPRPAKAARKTPTPTVQARSQTDHPKNSQTVVGIGASAGGLEAVQRFLEHLTPTTGMAFVLVQHLAPMHESFLPELLRSSARIPVVQVADGMSLENNRLHVIPPNVSMTVRDGHLHLEPRPLDRSQYNPIDSFFRSLAASLEHKAIGVVLSGSASDGAVGLREIKASGGLTIAQDPNTARFESMPRAALATGSVDLVLSPEDIAKELVRLGQHPYLNAPAAAPDFEMDEAQLNTLFRLLRAVSHIDFTHYKQPTIRRRMQRRMALHKVTDVGKYLELLSRDRAEVEKLYRDILIHVTRFFRDPDSFDALKRIVFPAIVQEASAIRRPIRIWVPGCATGEEAYSVAIALFEYLGNEAVATAIQIFATDVSDNAIERARAGVFPATIEGDVSPHRLRRFFTQVDSHYRIIKQIRDSCVLARQDLTRDPPFSKLDLIVCRNVLIYLGLRVQRKLMGVFHYALKPNGFLMLGSAESVGPHAELFTVVDKRHKIFTSRPGRRRAELEFTATADGEVERRKPPDRQALMKSAGLRSDLHAEITRLLLSRYSPPAVVIDSDLQIMETRGKTGPYLELPAGEATLNVLKMAREGLLHGLRSAIDEVRKTKKAARREGLLIAGGNGGRTVDVQILPLAEGGEPAYLLVLFEEHRRAADEKEGRLKKSKTRTTKEENQIGRLREELRSSREYLQSIIQDLEAANEELQSANEEILSSNEELQSTNEELDTAKEELQSTNEELNTVNEELNARNQELSNANSDLINLLGAVPAAIIIVSQDLRIRRFTPLAEQVLNLIPTDVGRPIGDLKPNIERADLEALTREVMETVSIREVDVRDLTGREYVLRIRPYKDQENRISGAVLAFLERAAATRA